MPGLVSACQIPVCLAAFLLSAPDAAAEPPHRPGGEHRPQHNAHHRGRPGFPFLRDLITSPTAGSAFRHYMLEDLKQHVPLLHSRMQEAFRIQHERQQLQAEKHRAGQVRSRSGTQFERFHRILEREEKLTRRMHALMEEAARDVTAIRQQVQARRKQIDAALVSGSPTDQRRSTETVFLRRAGRVYEFMDSRLERLEENPGQAEWIKPFLKGMFLMPEGPDSERADRLRQRLEQLQREQKELRARMQQLQEEIDALDVGEGGRAPEGPPPPFHRRKNGRPGGHQTPEEPQPHHRPAAAGGAGAAPAAQHPEGPMAPHPPQKTNAPPPPDSLFF